MQNPPFTDEETRPRTGKELSGSLILCPPPELLPVPLSERPKQGRQRKLGLCPQWFPGPAWAQRAGGQDHLLPFLLVGRGCRGLRPPSPQLKPHQRHPSTPVPSLVWARSSLFSPPFQPHLHSRPPPSTKSDTCTSLKACVLVKCVIWLGEGIHFYTT